MQEKVLYVQPTLAVKIGLKEAIFLQELHFLLNNSKYSFDGQKWVRKTIDEWLETFPFWSKDILRRIVEKLTKSKIISVEKLAIKHLDTANWYTINYDVLNDLLSRR
jgi:hypothetical protein